MLPSSIDRRSRTVLIREIPQSMSAADQQPDLAPMRHLRLSLVDSLNAIAKWDVYSGTLLCLHISAFKRQAEAKSSS